MNQYKGIIYWKSHGTNKVGHGSHIRDFYDAYGLMNLKDKMNNFIFPEIIDYFILVSPLIRKIYNQE